MTETTIHDSDPILPDTPHTNRIPWGPWRFVRTSLLSVRVFGPEGWVEIHVPAGSRGSDAVKLAKASVRSGEKAWKPKPSGPSGPSPHAERDGRRVEVYLDDKGAEALDRGRARLGTNAAAIREALVRVFKKTT